MLVTVAICTWNRSKLLDQTLSRMVELQIPAGVEWELLIVNNNSPDDTDMVIEKYRAQGKLPILRLFERKQGLSNARNCALSVAHGELVIWTDDDVLVDPYWLKAYVSAAKRFPEAAFFGGAIHPWYEKAPPDWVSHNQSTLFGMLVLRDLPEPEGISESEFFGANMAFRADVLRTRSFDALLGVKGKLRIAGEETEIMHMLRASGLKGVWVPDAVVHHYTTADRMTLSYAWNYFVGYGRTVARREGRSNAVTLFRVPRYLFREFASYLFRTGLAVCTRKNWLLPFLDAAQTFGKIVESRNRLNETITSLNDEPNLSRSC